MRTLYFCHVVYILFLSFFIPRLISAVADWTSTILRHMMWPQCEFTMHLRTIAQLYRPIYSQLMHVSTIGKKLVKQQYLLHMSLQYAEVRPTNSWDLLASLVHHSKLQRVLRHGSVTARHSSSGRQPNFAALNKGRHLYLAGRPSRWAFAQISSYPSTAN